MSDISELEDRIVDLECRLELRDKRITEQRIRADLAEAEALRWKKIAENAIESENITIDKLTLTEIELDTERKQRVKTEALLDVEKALVDALEDVLKATAKIRERV